MIRTFRDAIREISPPWLRRGTAEKILYALAIQFDGLADASVAAVKYRFPGFYGFESLPFLSRDRRIQRGRTEDDETFAKRLLSWLDDHRTRGNPYALLRQLHAHFAPQSFPIQLIYASGRRFSMDVDGHITWDDIEWTPPGDPSNWARWWLFYEAPQFIQTINWDDPGITWDDGHVWDLGLAPAEVQDLSMIPNSWNSAHAIGRVVLLDEGESWDSYPPGEWPFQIALRGQLMTAPLVPVAQDDTANIIPPETGLPVAAGVVRAAFQGVVNTLQLLTNYAQDHRLRRATLNFAYVPGGQSVGGVFALEVGALDSPSPESWTVDPTTHQITVPRAGHYQVMTKCATSVAHASIPCVSNIRFQIGDSAWTDFGWATGERWAGTAADAFLTVGFADVIITDPATQRLRFKNMSPDTLTFANASGDEEKLHPIVISYLAPF